MTFNNLSGQTSFHEKNLRLFNVNIHTKIKFQPKKISKKYYLQDL